MRLRRTVSMKTSDVPAGHATVGKRTHTSTDLAPPRLVELVPFVVPDIVSEGLAAAARAAVENLASTAIAAMHGYRRLDPMLDRVQRLADDLGELVSTVDPRRGASAEVEE